MTAARAVSSPSLTFCSSTKIDCRLRQVGIRLHRRHPLPSFSTPLTAQPWTSSGQHRKFEPVRSSLDENNALADNERELLHNLRVAISSLGGNSEDVDENGLLRFLQAHSLKVEKAAEKVIAHLQWRADFKPQGFVSEAEIPDQLALATTYLQGHTKQGYPLFVTLGRKHFPTADFEQFKRFVVYFLDKAIACAPSEEPHFVGIVDLKGLGLKNLDTKAFIGAFTIVQDHYPGNLHKLYLVNVPFIFNGVWKVASPFLDEQIRSKVIFVPDKSTKETLLSEIEEDQLPIEYGGRAHLVPLDHAVVTTYTGL